MRTTREMTGENEPSSYKEDYYPNKNFSTVPVRMQLKQVTRLVN